MKKNFLYPMMALFMLLFTASCSQEEILSDSSNPKTITMNVTIPTGNGPSTRALPAEVAGHQLRCIMQIINKTDNSVIETKTAKVTVENVTFTFDTPEAEYLLLFWADYIPENAELTANNLYNIEKLTNITYAKTDNSLFNSAAADAFCGKVLQGGEASGVTLKRPFAKMTLKPADSQKADFEGYDKLKAIYKTPSGYNVMSGTTAGWTEVTYNDAITTDSWFSTFVFASNNTASLDDGAGNLIKMEFTDTATESPKAPKNVKVEGSAIHTGENVNADVKVETKNNSSTSVEITINGDFIDPNVLAVGKYIYADGTYGDDATDAIAVVFALANEIAGNDDAAADYGDSYKDKTIAGYAVALENIVKVGNRPNVRQDMNDGSPAWPAITTTKALGTTFKGYSATQTLLSYVNTFRQTDGTNNVSEAVKGISPLYDAYETWVGDSNNGTQYTSPWYIPSLAQSNYFFEKVLGESAVAALTAIIDPETSFVPDNGSDTFFASSCVLADAKGGDKISSTAIGNKENTPTTLINKAGKCAIKDGKATIRPILTVFEGITKK